MKGDCKMIKKITYVTGNWAKIASARQILEPLGIEVDNIKMDTIEIQADDVEYIARLVLIKIVVLDMIQYVSAVFLEDTVINRRSAPSVILILNLLVQHNVLGNGDPALSRSCQGNTDANYLNKDIKPDNYPYCRKYHTRHP